MKIRLLLIVIFTILLSWSDCQACSSFMLKAKSDLIYAHNLDISGNMPGMVFINKRGVQKTGYTWEQLTSVERNTNSCIYWTPIYGSLTFNAFGRDLPDGGMNERGLFIWEMTGGSTFDTIAERPRLFMSQWIQYQLDNFKSVGEVLNNLSAIGLDGWNWHFFIADKEGETAAIEFIDGVTIIYTKDNMPIPIMGNGRYSEDMSILKQFDGFGGSIAIDNTDPNLPGMVKAAKLIKDYDATEKIEDYGFSILEKLSGKVSKWAVIFDVKNLKCYFRTAQFPNIKSFSINAIDFSANTPVQILNIQNADLTENVNNDFIDFNDEDNFALARETAAKLYKIDDFQISKDTLIYRLATAYESSGNNVVRNIEGTWTGYAIYPTTGEPAKVDWKLQIEDLDGKLVGKITDSAGLFEETEMYNLRFENGIFRFTSYAYGYVFLISAKVSNNGIKGVIDFSNETRKGNFYVQLN